MEDFFTKGRQEMTENLPAFNTFEDLLAFVNKTFPGAMLDEDQDGQLMIYLSLKQDKNGILVDC